MQKLNLFKIAVAGFCLVAINTFAHPCLSDKAMKCNATAQASTIMLTMYIIIQLVGIVRKEISDYKDLAGVLLPLGILAATQMIGACKMKDMDCWVRMLPVLVVCCIGLLGLWLCGLIIEGSKGHETSSTKES